MVTPALERLVEANTLLSGLGFESSGLAAAHAVHNGLTVAPETHRFLHGEKVAFGLLAQLVMEGASRSTVEEVLAFSTSVGLPITLAQIGLPEVPASLLDQIAHRAQRLERLFTTNHSRSHLIWSPMRFWRQMLWAGIGQEKRSSPAALNSPKKRLDSLMSRGVE